MKKTLLLSALFILVNTAFAREPLDTIPQPEFINYVYHFDKKNNKLVDLEKANVEMKLKMKIVGGGSQSYSIDGSKSSMRLSEAANSFMITISGGAMTADPTNTLTLYKLESKKNKREAPMTSYAGMNTGQNSNNTMELKFKKIKEGTFEIVVAGKLEKGEYGFINMSGMNQTGKIAVFAFGVD